MVATAKDARSLWYFAYGSNMSDAIFRARRRMRPLAARRARLDGWALCFDIPVGPGERAVANLTRDSGAHVWGVCYLLWETECARLDRTEGVPRVYARVPVEVTSEGGPLEAFTYVSRISVSGRKPSPRYLGLLLDGARAYALPTEWIAYLDGLERARDERVPQA